MKKLFADVCFAVQIICTVIWGYSQFCRLLTSTEGISITWFVFWEGFLILHLWLAFSAHRAQPSRVTLQTVCSYALWTVVITANIAVMVCKKAGVWSDIDTLTAFLGGVGALIVLIIARHRRISIEDPIVKGWLAVFCKSIPQLLLAYTICQEGGSGLAAATVFTGHVTILTRLVQLVLSVREAGWDRNRTASLASEIANEATWIVVTVAWLVT